MIADAVDTAELVFTAAVLWAGALAAAVVFVVGVVLLAVPLLVAPGVKAARSPTPPRRRIPSWAHTQPLNPGDGRGYAPDRS